MVPLLLLIDRKTVSLAPNLGKRNTTQSQGTAEQMTWFLATCYEGAELRCRDRLLKHYPHLQAYVPVGKTVRKALGAKSPNDYRLVDFAGYDGYVFTELPSNINWQEFFFQTRFTGFVRKDLLPAEITSATLDNVKHDEACNAFSTKLAQALLYFESLIGTEITIKNGMLTGRQAEILTISGTYVRVRVKMSGSSIEHSVPAKLLYGKDACKKAQLLEIGNRIIAPAAG